MVEDWMAGQLDGSRRSRKSLNCQRRERVWEWAIGRTFMYISWEKRAREGGCSRRTPWIRSSVCMINMSFVPLLSLPRSLSRQATSLMEIFHWKDCWSLKNSRKAGSSERSFNFLPGGDVEPKSSIDCRLLAMEVLERHSWARRPSTWRRPLRIFWGDEEER